MRKMNLFKTIAMMVVITGATMFVGCGSTNNVATNDTEVSVEVVSASDVMADEDVNETADDTGVVTDEETVEIKSETSNENKTVSSEKVGKTEDKSVSGNTNAGSAVSTPETTGATETVKPSSTESKVADSIIASGNSNGTTTSSKPSNIPSNVPSSATTPKPVEVAKNVVAGTSNSKTNLNTSGNGGVSASGESGYKGYSSKEEYDRVTNKGKGWTVDGNWYATQAEANAAVDAEVERRKNSYTTTVTVNNGVTDAMNKYREENGKAAVSSNDYLDEKAKTRAEEIAKDFTHNSASGLTGQENIQANYGGGATNEQVVKNYSESFGHNGTMLDAYQSASSATATVTDVDGNVVAQYDVTVFADFDDNSVNRLDGPPDYIPQWMLDETEAAMRGE